MAQSTQLDPSVKKPSYPAHQQKVQETYDCFLGQMRNERHLPRLKGQNDAEYEAYAKRAPILNAVEMATQNLIGVMMRNPLTMTGAQPEEVLAEDSLSFDGFIQDLIMDTALGGRVLIGVDIDEDSGLPYLDYYASENVINWCDDFIILETCETKKNPKNPYEEIEYKRWKELFIANEDSNVDEALYGTFCAREWVQDGKKFVCTEPVQMLINGAPLNYIPYWWATAYDNSDELYNPTMYVLAGLQSAHYRLSSDHYHGLHFLGMPTFTISGDLYRDQDGNTPSDIVIGSTKQALHLEKDGKAGFVEFSGAGLGAILAEKEKVEQQMSDAGAELISINAQQETAEAARLRAGAETASIVTMSNALETALNMALEVYGQAVGRTITVELNKNFTDTVGQEQAPPEGSMDSVISLKTAGAITNADLVSEAKRRGVVAESIVAQTTAVSVSV
jgi:hypothetical protein